MSRFNISMVEYPERGGALVSDLGVVEMPLADFAAMHPKSEFRIYTHAGFPGQMFGKLVFGGGNRSNLYVDFVGGEK